MLFEVRNDGKILGLLKRTDVLFNDNAKKIVALMKANGGIKVIEISRQVGLGMTTITKF